MGVLLLGWRQNGVEGLMGGVLLYVLGKRACVCVLVYMFLNYCGKRGVGYLFCLMINACGIRL